MDESKQKRKTPLTTVAISQEYAFKMDEYLKSSSLTRKDFVELAVNYFTRTGFDIRSEAYDLTPLEKVADRLEKSVGTIEEANETNADIKKLLQSIQVNQEQNENLKKAVQVLHEFNFVSKNLPEPKDIEQRVSVEKKLDAAENHIGYLEGRLKILEEWRREAIDEFNRISNEQKTFGKIKITIPKV